MSHMVIYRSAEGKPAYHQTEELADAATFVERLRNEEGVESARIFRLDEIVFDYKAVYRVRISGSDEAVAARVSPPEVPTPMPAVTPARAATMTVPAVAPTAEPVSASPPGVTRAQPPVSDERPDENGPNGGNGARRGLFGR